MADLWCSLHVCHFPVLTPASLCNSSCHSHRVSLQFFCAAPLKSSNERTILSWCPAALRPCFASPHDGMLHARHSDPSEATGDQEEYNFTKFHKLCGESRENWKPQREDNALKKAVKLDIAGLGTERGDEESYRQEARNDDPEAARENGKKCSSKAETALSDVPFATQYQEEFDQVNEPTFRLTLSELLDEARVIPVLVIGDQNVGITGIQHDSRQVSPGDIFVCCSGYTTDGHMYIAEAAGKGAVVVVASKQVPVHESVKAVVLVKDTNSILSALSAAFYHRPSKKLSVVGITGTNGKTTTSYLLKSMYEAMERRTGLLGTIAHYINGKRLEASNTTPDAVSLQSFMAAMVHNSTNVCIMEVSSHALALDRCNEVDFDIAVFTNLTRDHMDFHKTEHAYKEAKGRLFAKMTDPQRHVKVVNMDDQHAPYFIELGNPDVPVVTFSMENREADVCPLEVKLSLFKTEVLVHTPRGNIIISSRLLGRHNVYNILTAVSVGIAVNAPLREIVLGIEEVHGVLGRCELINEKQTFAVIVDYAHTPDALSRLLDTIRECGARRIITVIGCGGDRDRGKRPIMAKIATDKSEVSIFTSDNPRTEDPLYILDDMLAGVGWSMRKYLEHRNKDSCPLQNGCRLFVYDKRSEAIRAAVAMGEEGDAVVIAGKGHETYQIIGHKKDYFSDSEECHKALQNEHAPHSTGLPENHECFESNPNA